MNTSVQPEQISEQVCVPDNASEAVSQIVDRAKVDRKGVFWSLGVNYRQDTTRFESSLGYGNSGILLALLEYYRCTKDKEIAELIHKGAAWIQNRVQDTSFLHGFYAGAGGQWYLWRELEQVLPDSIGNWTDGARAALTAQTQGEIPASLALGSAGTIVGALSALQLSAEEEAVLLKPLLEQMIGAARFSPDGVFWDFNATSLLPPLGFLFGNAGVDYCLAHLRRRLNASYTSLLAGSLARAAALFDNHFENWPDYDSMSEFKHLGQADIEKMLDKGGKAEAALSTQAEDTLGWGSGVMGVLLSRAALSISYRDNRIGEQALSDCRKAIERLARVTEQELAGLDASLQLGLSGIVLSLRAYTGRMGSIGLSVPEGLLQKVEALLVARKPVVEDEDLSLLTGIAGPAYALLKIASKADDYNCIDPLAAESLDSATIPAPEGELDSLLKRRLPSCGTVAGVKTALEGSVVSLATVNAAVADQYTREPASILTKAIKHELGLHQQLAQTPFRDYFWREVMKRRRFAQSYAEGMNDNLLFERFRIDEGVALFELDIDPYIRGDLANGQKLLIIRQVTSQGIFEAKLSALQFALLSGFREGAFALQLIREVIQRVETPNVTQRQLAELSLKMVRAFVGAGYLVSDSPKKIEAWMIRKRLKAMRNNLFPAATT